MHLDLTDTKKRGASERLIRQSSWLQLVIPPLVVVASLAQKERVARTGSTSQYCGTNGGRGADHKRTLLISMRFARAVIQPLRPRLTHLASDQRSL